MLRILKFTYNKLSQVLNFLHTQYFKFSLKLSKLYNKTINSKKYLGLGYT